MVGVILGFLAARLQDAGRAEMPSVIHQIRCAEPKRAASCYPQAATLFPSAEWC
jgi:hypothetical protein